MATVVNTDFTAPVWGSFAQQSIAFEAAHGVVQKAEIQVIAKQFGVTNVATALMAINKAVATSLKFSDVILFTGTNPANAVAAEAEFLRRVIEAHHKKVYGFNPTATNTATTDATVAANTLAVQTVLAGVIGNGGGNSWASIYAASPDFGKASFKYTVGASPTYTVTEDVNGTEITFPNYAANTSTILNLLTKNSLATGIQVPLLTGDVPDNSFSLANAVRYACSKGATTEAAIADVTAAVLVEAWTLANTAKSLTDVNAINLSTVSSVVTKISKSVVLKSGKFDIEIKKLATYDEIWAYIDTVLVADRFKKFASASNNYRFYTLAVSRFLNFVNYLNLPTIEVVRIISTDSTGSTTIKTATDAADTIAVATASAVATATNDAAGVAGVSAGFTVTGNTQPQASTVGVNTLDALDFFNASASLNIRTAQDVCDFLSNYGLQKPPLTATTGSAGLNGNGTRWAAFLSAYGVNGNTCTTDLNIIYDGLVLLAKLCVPANSNEQNIAQVVTWLPLTGLTVSSAVPGISFPSLSNRETGLIGIALQMKDKFPIVGNSANYNVINSLVKLGTESGENKVSKLYARYSTLLTVTSGILGNGFTKDASPTAADKLAMYQWFKSITMDKLTLLRAYVSIVYTTVDTFAKVLEVGRYSDFSLDYLMKLPSAPVALDGTSALFTAPATVFHTAPTNVTVDEDKPNQTVAAVFEMAVTDGAANNGALKDVVGRGLIHCIAALGSSNYEFFAFTRGVAIDAAKTGMSTLESYMISVNMREACKYGDGGVLLGAVAVALADAISSSTKPLGLPLIEAYPKLTVSQSLLISEFASLITRILNKPLNIRFKEVRVSISSFVRTLMTSYDIDNSLAIIVLVEAMSGPDKKISKREYDELISLGISELQIKCAVRAELDVVGTSIKSTPKFSSYLEYVNGDVSLSAAF